MVRPISPKERKKRPPEVIVLITGKNENTCINHNYLRTVLNIGFTTGGRTVIVSGYSYLFAILLPIK
jgi:hypothetical protein